MLVRLVVILGVIALLATSLLIYNRSLPVQPDLHAAKPLEDLPPFPTTFPANLPQPQLDMTPDEIVRTVLAALHDNDAPTKGAGIATCFNFASPQNRAATGPLPRFAAMIQGPAYAPLLNHRKSEIGTPRMDRGTAVFRVLVIDAHERPATYFFQLSQQPNGQWMTDDVQRIEHNPTAGRQRSQGLGS